MDLRRAARQDAREVATRLELLRKQLPEGAVEKLLACFLEEIFPTICQLGVEILSDRKKEKRRWPHHLHGVLVTLGANSLARVAKTFEDQKEKEDERELLEALEARLFLLLCGLFSERNSLKVSVNRISAKL